MFQAKKEKFGQFERVSIAHEESGNKLSLVPEHGACLVDLQLDGLSVLDGYQTPQELDFNNWSKSRFLFPFPNRLKHGTYHWDDVIYQFPINDGQTGNALHGMGMTDPFRYTQLETSADEAVIECSYKNDGKNPAYPFRFSIVVSFTLSADNRFELQMTFQNLHDKPVPVGIGWHPYFMLDGQGVDKWRLQLPPCEMIGIDPQMIPTGKRYEYDRFKQERMIQSEVLDNCFALTEPQERASLMLSNEKHRLEYWQEMGTGKFDYIQLFTPPHRKSLAIEPMTCNVDAFNNGDGLVRLHPGERLSAHCGLSLSSL